MCVDNKKWDTLNDMITAICKKRAQLQKVMHSVISESMKYIELTPSKEIKLSLLNTLRTAAAGKVRHVSSVYVLL